MAEDILREMGNTYAQQELLSSLQARMARPVQAVDPSGAVEVTVGADGLPTSFEVDEGWTRSLHPTAIGGAVVAAFQAAATRRLAMFAELMDEVDVPETDSGAQAAPPQQVQAPAPSNGHYAPINIDELLSEVLALTDDIDALAEAEVYRAHGSAASGMLTLTLGSDSTVSCEVDQAWASDKSGSELTAALNAALGSARSALTQSAEADPANRAMKVIDQAAAFLKGQSA